MADPTGRVALVTGAGSGVGRATARRLAAAGLGLGLLGRRPEPLEALAAELADAGGRAVALPADVADEPAVAAAVARLSSELGGVDVLVHSAGIGRYGPVDGYPLHDWEQTFATNVTGLFLCARAVIPVMRRRGGGAIVAISSGAGKRGVAGRAAYSASKFAVLGFMEALAEEVRRDGIKCATVVPGSVLTAFGPQTVAEKRASGNRYLEPEDVADAILYLLEQPARAWTQELNLWPF
ncbi:MAG TPA: SDR family NAD(P)-dependent oxidoreductase [Thermomicrobiaceae bacterium]|nr:SDR family NAD(P)-dependent oxidoreductase [Thermomicrobiaceae bacterium]